MTAPVRLPYTLLTVRSLFRFQRSSAEVYVSVAAVVGPVIVIPAPLACAAVVAFLASSILMSATETVVELTVVVVPLTVKSPETVRLPDAVILVLVISSDVRVPLTVTLLNVTLSLLPTAWPIAIAPVEELYVTPVLPLRAALTRVSVLNRFVPSVICEEVLGIVITPLVLLYAALPVVALNAALARVEVK